MQTVRDAAKRFLKDEGGASMIEYSILVGIITVAAITAISNMGLKVGDWWTKLDTGTGAVPK